MHELGLQPQHFFGGDGHSSLAGPPRPGADPDFDRRVAEFMRRKEASAAGYGNHPMQPSNGFENDVSSEMRRLEEAIKQKFMIDPGGPNGHPQRPLSREMPGASPSALKGPMIRTRSDSSGMSGIMGSPGVAAFSHQQSIGMGRGGLFHQDREPRGNGYAPAGMGNILGSPNGASEMERPKSYGMGRGGLFSSEREERRDRDQQKAYAAELQRQIEEKNKMKQQEIYKASEPPLTGLPLGNSSSRPGSNRRQRPSPSATGSGAASSKLEYKKMLDDQQLEAERIRNASYLSQPQFNQHGQGTEIPSHGSVGREPQFNYTDPSQGAPSLNLGGGNESSSQPRGRKNLNDLHSGSDPKKAEAARKQAEYRLALKQQMLQDEEKKKLEKKEQEEYERNVEKGVFPATKKAHNGQNTPNQRSGGGSNLSAVAPDDLMHRRPEMQYPHPMGMDQNRQGPPSLPYADQQYMEGAGRDIPQYMGPQYSVVHPENLGYPPALHLNMGQGMANHSQYDGPTGFYPQPTGLGYGEMYGPGAGSSERPILEPGYGQFREPYYPPPLNMQPFHNYGGEDFAHGMPPQMRSPSKLDQFGGYPPQEYMPPHQYPPHEMVPQMRSPSKFGQFEGYPQQEYMQPKQPYQYSGPVQAQDQPQFQNPTQTNNTAQPQGPITEARKKLLADVYNTGSKLGFGGGGAPVRLPQQQPSQQQCLQPPAIQVGYPPGSYAEENTTFPGAHLGVSGPGTGSPSRQDKHTRHGFHSHDPEFQDQQATKQRAMQAQKEALLAQMAEVQRKKDQEKEERKREQERELFELNEIKRLEQEEKEAQKRKHQLEAQQDREAHQQARQAHQQARDAEQQSREASGPPPQAPAVSSPSRLQQPHFSERASSRGRYDEQPEGPPGFLPQSFPQPSLGFQGGQLGFGGDQGGLDDRAAVQTARQLLDQPSARPPSGIRQPSPSKAQFQDNQPGKPANMYSPPRVVQNTRNVPSIDDLPVGPGAAKLLEQRDRSMQEKQHSSAAPSPAQAAGRPVSAFEMNRRKGQGSPITMSAPSPSISEKMGFQVGQVVSRVDAIKARLAEDNAQSNRPSSSFSDGGSGNGSPFSSSAKRRTRPQEQGIMEPPGRLHPPYGTDSSQSSLQRASSARYNPRDLQGEDFEESLAADSRMCSVPRGLLSRGSGHCDSGFLLGAKKQAQDRYEDELGESKVQEWQQKYLKERNQGCNMSDLLHYQNSSPTFRPDTSGALEESIGGNSKMVDDLGMRTWRGSTAGGVFAQGDMSLNVPGSRSSIRSAGFRKTPGSATNPRRKVEQSLGGESLMMYLNPVEAKEQLKVLHEEDENNNIANDDWDASDFKRSAKSPASARSSFHTSQEAKRQWNESPLTRLVNSRGDVRPASSKTEESFGYNDDFEADDEEVFVVPGIKIEETRSNKPGMFKVHTPSEAERELMANSRKVSRPPTGKANHD